MNPRWPWFTLLLGALAAVFHHSLATLIGSSLSVDQYSHVLLVVPVSLALLYLEREHIAAVASYSLAGAALLILLLAAFAATRGYRSSLSPDNALSLSVLFFVACSVAAFIFCFGPPAFRPARFPLLFLFLMVPFPDALLRGSITLLQNGSAEATAALFKLANIPFTREGVFLLLPRATIEIASECSGIRSSLVLFITSLVLGKMFLNSGWTRTTLAIAVLPLTIAKNGLRIFVLSMLGMYADPSFLSGSLHRKGGILFFALAFGCLLLLIRVLQKFEHGGHDGREQGIAAEGWDLPPQGQEGGEDKSGLAAHTPYHLGG
jgi:exosortase